MFFLYYFLINLEVQRDRKLDCTGAKYNVLYSKAESFNTVGKLKDYYDPFNITHISLK